MIVNESPTRSRWRRAVDRLRPTRTASGIEDRLPWAVLLLGLVVLVLVVGGALWFTLDWLEGVAAVKVDPNAAIGGKDFVTAKLDAVKIALTAVAGGVALFALYLAVRRQITAERDLRARLDAQAHTEDDARSRRVTELYTKAADQLGSDKAPVRLAGLYALERLGQDNPDQRPTIASLWCAYLRMPYTPPPSTPVPATRSSAGVPRPLLRDPHRRSGIRRPDPDTASSPDRTSTHAEAVLERDVRLSVQRLLAKHLRPQPDDSGQPHSAYWPEIPELDLTEATLIDFGLDDCHLPPLRMDSVTFIGGASFGDTTFNGIASFGDTTFNGIAWFSGATFIGDAGFIGATFASDARFNGVTFASTAWFHRTTFTRGAEFVGATFKGDAEFVSAIFTGNAEFREVTVVGYASFSGAVFTSDAGFVGATFTSELGFFGATFSGDTTFDDAAFESAASFSGAPPNGRGRDLSW
nr:pentapeptide repeat-containing protein [Streptomyces sp. 44030]